MKKIFLLASLLSLLTGCFYSDGCFYTPQMVNCVDKGKEWPAIAHYQKPYSVGKTDSQQRWKDAVACGSKYGDEELRYIYTKTRLQGDTTIFQSCMEKKGYHKYWPAECGYQNPKWDKGKCNL